MLRRALSGDFPYKPHYLESRNHPVVRSTRQYAYRMAIEVHPETGEVDPALLAYAVETIRRHALRRFGGATVYHLEVIPPDDGLTIGYFALIGGQVMGENDVE
jgi:hypothetical protein